jgi:hypothetical protein
MTSLQSLLRRALSLPSVLAIVALCYVRLYFVLPASPAYHLGSVNSLGWWAWGDQGLYMKSAQALLSLNLAPEQHFYPPLYAAIAAVFLPWSAIHAYFFINLICLLWFAFVFIRVCDRYVARWIGVFLFFASTVFNRLIFENFVIPWTTTLGVALLASGILGLVWLEEVRQNPRAHLAKWQVGFVALSLGLLVPTRPVDALVGILIGSAFVIGYESGRSGAADRMPKQSTFWSMTILGAVIGPAIFIIFNQLVFGSPLGNYVQAASSNGFFIADLPEKFYSIWLDGNTLYGESKAGLVQHFPWLLIGLAGWLWVLITGSFLLRTLALSIALLFTLYLPYGDLLPNGLWRYLNVHYFKWTFTLFALFAYLLLSQIFQAWREKKAWLLPTLLLLIIPVFLLSVQLRLKTEPMQWKISPAGVVQFTLPSQPIDFIEMQGLKGEFAQTYFGDHSLMLDGKILKPYKDFRLLEQGAGLRLLFIRPIEGKQIEWLADQRVALYKAVFNARAGSYAFTLGMPKFYKKAALPTTFATYELGSIINFSDTGLAQFYLGEGFSDPEATGRWTINDKALLRMQLMNVARARPLWLELTYRSLVGDAQPCQQIVISANAQVVGNESICLKSSGNNFAMHRYQIPASAIEEDGVLNIGIATPNSVTPKQLKINDGQRKLGIQIEQLNISQPSH